MINIRDREFRVVARVPDVAGFADRCRAHRLERADFWPRADGSATLGVAWEDGSTAIGDVPDMAQAQAWARHECPDGTRVHIKVR